MRLTIGLFNVATAAAARPWREAATLILASPSSPSSTESGSHRAPVDSTGSIEYLVTQRSPKSSFYPNGVCFPGGVLSAADSDKGWLRLFQDEGIDLKSLTFFDASAHRPPIYNEENTTNHFSKEIILRLTAIRETFEEAGVLVCKTTQKRGSNHELLKDVPELKQWQKRVRKQPEMFLTLCQELGVFPDVESLYDWSNWLTPAMFPPKYRFDTIFYISIKPRPQHIIIDEQEVVNAFSATALQLIEFSEGTTGKLPPPQLYELTSLKDIGSVVSLEKLARLRKAKGLERWCPAIFKTTDARIGFLPGDDMYPQNVNVQESSVVPQLDSTLTEITTSTKNHHRMKLYPDPMTVHVNIRMPYGQEYTL